MHNWLEIKEIRFQIQRKGGWWKRLAKIRGGEKKGSRCKVGGGKALSTNGGKKCGKKRSR